MSEDRIRPFDSGTQFADWEERNCNRCRKSYLNNKEKFKCDLDEAIGVAYLGDGTISAEEAKRIGFKQPGPDGFYEYTWKCAEFQPATKAQMKS